MPIIHEKASEQYVPVELFVGLTFWVPKQNLQV